MKIAIMQPYFLPWLGYFSIIKHTDKFILFDPVQFIRHGWIERNRILKQHDGWIYIKVPLVRHSQQALIKEIVIDNSQPWRQKILAQIVTYKKLSSRYEEVRGLIEEVVTPSFTSIVELNRHALQAVCNYLGIETELHIWSQMNLTIEQPKTPDEWALNTCKALGNVDEYWNPPGGQRFFDSEKYKSAGLKLRFHQQILHSYDQRRKSFEPGLSIIDALMFNSPEAVNEMLDEYDLS
jgi:hypothetical protein